MEGRERKGGDRRKEIKGRMGVGEWKGGYTDI